MELLKEQKLEQLEKVLQSRTLREAENLKAFLRFAGLRAIDDQDSYLKEYTIATEVFGRRSGYDSRNDSVVRVQAGRLRSKLQKYYDTEGKNDLILIDIPKGHYTPVFSYIETTRSEEATDEVIVPVTDSSLETIVSEREPRSTARNWSRPIIACLIIASVALGFLALKYWTEANRLKSSTSSTAFETEEIKAALPLWGDFLHSPEPILVAFSNALFRGTAETGMKVMNPIGSPATAQPSGVKNDSESVITDHYTGIGEVLGVYSLGDLFYKASRSIRVKRSLMLTWDDLKTENIIILGSPAENFVLRDLPQQQDFVFQPLKDDKQNMALGIVNTKPKDGEQQTYLAKQEGPSRSQISEDYAVISLLRGLDEKHRLMILAGITTFGTQAAAEYVTKPEHIKDLIAHLDTSQSGDSPKLPSFYQVLIKVKVNGGVPIQISYVTHHVL